MKIEHEGKFPKFVNSVNQITFSGRVAMEKGTQVVYVSERGVFKLTPEGVMLTEIAPGLDLEKDILAQMDFAPIISPNLKTMDASIFTPGRMGYFDGKWD